MKFYSLEIYMYGVLQTDSTEASPDYMYSIQYGLKQIWQPRL